MVASTQRPADSGIDWFGADVPAEARAVLAELAHPRTFEPGEILFHEGEEATWFAILRSGRVALRMLVPERGEVTILTVEPGDVLNWSAVTPPYRSTSTAHALEPVEVTEFEGAALRGVLRSDPRLAAVVYPRLLAAVARRLTGTREQLLDVFASEASPPW
jgi:CRP-like cAMP-binding protein